MNDQIFIQEKKQDLANETFLIKWPKWLRWLLFLPAAFIVPTLFSLILVLIQTWFLDIGENAFYINFVRGIVTGYGFIVVGSMVAPSYQKTISLLLMIAFSMITGIGLFLIFTGYSESTFNETLEIIITLISSGIGTYYVFNELKE